MAGVAANFSDITPLPHSVAVRVKNAERFVSWEFGSKQRINIDRPPSRSIPESGTNRIATKNRGAKLFFRGHSRGFYEMEGCSPVALNAVGSDSNNSSRSADVEQRNGRFSYKRLPEFAKSKVTRPTDVR
jgi:hypothetical protein